METEGSVEESQNENEGCLPFCNVCSQRLEANGEKGCSFCAHKDSEESADVVSLCKGDETPDNDNGNDNGDGNEADFPEGGWGWIVVLASFFNSFIFDGIGGSFGVLYPYVHEKFQASAFVTSFAGSMFAAYLIMGSVGAFFVRKYGFRAVAVSGGVLSCVALVAASFAPNIYVFILCYGVMGGAAVGLVYLSSMVIVNGYFNKRRGITNGIISSGAGMGLLVMAPVTNALLDHYSLNGTVLILAGVMLNICVFSCCFRQPKIYNSANNQVRLTEVVREETDSEENTEESSVDNSLDHIEHIKPDSEQQLLENHQDSSLDSNIELPPPIMITCVNEKEKQTDIENLTVHNDNQLCEIHGSYSLLRKPHLDDNLWKRSLTHLVMKNEFDRLKNSHKMLPSHHSTYTVSNISNKEYLTNTSIKRSLNYLPIKHDIDKFTESKRRYQYQSSLSTNVFTDIGANSYLTGSISHLMNIHNQHFASAHQLHVTSQSNLESCMLKLPQNKDSSLSDNTQTGCAFKEDDPCLPPDSKYFTSHRSIHSNQMETFISTTDLPCSTEISQQPLGYSIAQLLRMISFHLFCAGACLIQVGYPVPGIFLADLAASHGIPSRYSAMMISLIGSFNMGGRLLAGVLGNLNFNPIRLNDMAMFFAAVLCFLSPLFTQIWSLCLFAACYGFLLGFFPPLQPLIIIKYFGIGSLASTFGLVTSLKGVAGLFGPPLAGWIYDMSLDYSISIIFAGVAFLLSVIVNETLVFVISRRSLK